MDEGTKYRVPIGDACVSMRVCFDSLCFSSTQRLADEEDAAAAAAAAASSQLPAHGNETVVAAAVTTAVTATATATASTTQVTRVPHVGAGMSAVIATGMGTLRELQELLRVKDERIAELEAILRSRDAEIQELRSHLDKFLSVLPFKPPLTPTKPRPRKQRAQGISAEPPLQELAPLAVIDKSDRLVPRGSVFLRTRARKHQHTRMHDFSSRPPFSSTPVYAHLTLARPCQSANFPQTRRIFLSPLTRYDASSSF